MRSAVNVLLIAAVSGLALPVQNILADIRKPTEKEACFALNSAECRAFMATKHHAYYSPSDRKSLTGWLQMDNRRNRKH